nr:ribonuclease H-like domain-containing protein [Tanacetum cinerariifolium]
MSDHEDETITEENAHPKVVPQITTVTNIFAKFPYLKKGEYDIWAMKMQNFISSSDLLCWNIVLKGNNAKSMTTDNDGNLKIRPPVTTEKHQQVQREEKARTILLSALPDEHMGDFYHMIDARDIWNAIKARFEEGLDKGYDKMQKIPTQMNTLKIKPEPEDVNMKFLRGLPPSWSGIALMLKTKGGLEYISFDDLYNKLKFLEIDTKGGSSKSKCSVVDDVIYSFFVNYEIDQHLVYEDLDQMNKEDFEEYDLKHQSFLPLEYSVSAGSTSLLLLVSITAVKQIVIVS